MSINKIPSSFTRRDLLKTAILAGGSTVLLGAPLTAYVIAPSLKKGAGKWVDFGSTDALEPESFTMLSYEFMIKDGWLVLPQRGFVWASIGENKKVTVFSSTCTHLACNVIWNEEQRVFECPCHSGRFNVKGQPIAGPPTKPLRVLEYRIEEGNLTVHLAK